MQIAIDGPAGAGKSTIAKMVAAQLNIVYLDTGAMYRAITYAALSHRLDFDDTAAVAALAETAVIRFEGRQVFLNDEDVTAAIRDPEVSRFTSKVAVIPEVRALLVAQQQKIAGDTDVIMDGRDIGSVVLPEADYKFYLDATVEERARRRFNELKEKGQLGDKTLAAIEADIAQRDYNDAHRDVGPLVCCDDAVRVDTTGLDIPDVCAVILKAIGEDCR
ncbi:(d)CMP kinase [Pseudoramibacter alactolyticus]|jgi:cytidylate kinase|uniref:(d)CMP kinase n=1 Tax=Pseudoramibacter alactolyticus TaxID=113287 RepID=UPI0023580211|nr:(d)CMP kinase [Pseudoramibacter alactolyticus]MBM6969003.1 (d)CMP kinase [Pseudoramibacter alactolyticus]